MANQLKRESLPVKKRVDPQGARSSCAACVAPSRQLLQQQMPHRVQGVLVQPSRLVPSLADVQGIVSSVEHRSQWSTSTKSGSPRIPFCCPATFLSRQLPRTTRGTLLTRRDNSMSRHRFYCTGRYSSKDASTPGTKPLAAHCEVRPILNSYAPGSKSAAFSSTLSLLTPLEYINRPQSSVSMTTTHALVAFMSPCWPLEATTWHWTHRCPTESRRGSATMTRTARTTSPKITPRILRFRRAELPRSVSSGFGITPLSSQTCCGALRRMARPRH